MDSITPPFVSIHCDPEFFILGMEVEDLGGVGPPNPDFFKDEGTSRGRDLRAPMLGRGESVIEEWRRLVEYEVRGLSEGQVDPSQFRDALSRLLDKANEACINLLREREELAVISRERELDAMAHAELIRLKLGQLNASYALDREKMRLATTALQTAMEEVNEVTTQNRSLKAQHDTTVTHLRHAEAAAEQRLRKIEDLEERLAASALQAGFAVEGATRKPAEEEMEMIDDLGDELLSFHASTTGEDDVIERLRTRLKIEESKAKTAQEALAASQEEVRELSMKLGAMEVAAKLDEVASKAQAQVVLSPRIISPRSNDLQGLRAKFLEQYEVLRRKDEEIDELQKILFELRPKLEREVESQVKVIMDQARYDAEQLRVEASRMRDASANQVGWLEGELDNATREVEVLRGVALHRDVLLARHKSLVLENVELRSRLSRLEPPPGPPAPYRASARGAWTAAVLAVGVAVATSPLLAGVSCGVVGGEAVGAGGGWGWLRSVGSVGVRGGKVPVPTGEWGDGAVGRICRAVARSQTWDWGVGGRASALLAAGMLVGSVLTLVLPSSSAPSHTG